jgi:hypothetical protein
LLNLQFIAFIADCFGVLEIFEVRKVVALEIKELMEEFDLLGFCAFLYL